MTPAQALAAWLAAVPTEPTPEALLRYANAHAKLFEVISHAHVWNLAGCAVPSDLEALLARSIEMVRARNEAPRGGADADEALRVVEREQRDGGLALRLVEKAP